MRVTVSRELSRSFLLAGTSPRAGSIAVACHRSRRAGVLEDPEDHGCAPDRDQVLVGELLGSVETLAPQERPVLASQVLQYRFLFLDQDPGVASGDAGVVDPEHRGLVPADDVFARAKGDLAIAPDQAVAVRRVDPRLFGTFRPEGVAESL